MAIALLHFGGSPLMRVGTTLALAEQGAAAQRLSRTMSSPCGQDIYVVAASDPTVFFFAPLAATLEGKEASRSFRVLSMAPQDHRIENVRTSGFDLVTVGPRRLGAWEQLFRRQPLHPGDLVLLQGLAIRVVEVERGWPTRIRLDFDEPLSSPALCFVTYHNGGYEVLEPPRVGQTLRVPHEAGPMGM